MESVFQEMILSSTETPLALKEMVHGLIWPGRVLVSLAMVSFYPARMTDEMLLGCWPFLLLKSLISNWNFFLQFSSPDQVSWAHFY